MKIAPNTLNYKTVIARLNIEDGCFYDENAFILVICEITGWQCGPDWHKYQQVMEILSDLGYEAFNGEYEENDEHEDENEAEKNGEDYY